MLDDSMLITEADIALIRPRQPLPHQIIDKLTGSFPRLQASHNINPALYDTVYTTSDIHADVCKLNKLLSSARLIDSSGLEELDTINKPIRWLKPRTMFIIVGDIVDGARGPFSEIYDPVGDIELRLHIYLYNLRIKAQQIGSDIRFTIGNHDHHSVILKTDAGMPDFYKMWVHTTARDFFGSREIRRSCLLPFYMCCPYYILRFGKELAFVHGGLNADDLEGEYVESLAQNTIKIQKKLDATGEFNDLSPENESFLSLSVEGVPGAMEKGGPLWTRFYSFGSSDNVCDNLGEPFEMVIVGHCQTDGCSQGEHMKSIISKPQFAGCEKGGCVLLGCDKETGPSLAFVDIAMSSAFRDVLNPYTKRQVIARNNIKRTEAQRHAEFLKFEHNPTLKGDRYYNKIIRVSLEAGYSENLYWAAAKKTLGGKRTRQNKHKPKKLNTRKNKIRK